MDRPFVINLGSSGDVSQHFCRQIDLNPDEEKIRAGVIRDGFRADMLDEGMKWGLGAENRCENQQMMLADIFDESTQLRKQIKINTKVLTEMVNKRLIEEQQLQGASKQ